MDPPSRHLLLTYSGFKPPFHVELFLPSTLLLFTASPISKLSHSSTSQSCGVNCAFSLSMHEIVPNLRALALPCSQTIPWNPAPGFVRYIFLILSISLNCRYKLSGLSLSFLFFGFICNFAYRPSLFKPAPPVAEPNLIRPSDMTLSFQPSLSFASTI